MSGSFVDRRRERYLRSLDYSISRVRTHRAWCIIIARYHEIAVTTRVTSGNNRASREKFAQWWRASEIDRGLSVTRIPKVGPRHRADRVKVSFDYRERRSTGKRGGGGGSKSLITCVTNYTYYNNRQPDRPGVRNT